MPVHRIPESSPWYLPIDALVPAGVGGWPVSVRPCQGYGLITGSVQGGRGSREAGHSGPQVILEVYFDLSWHLFRLIISRDLFRVIVGWRKLQNRQDLKKCSILS